MPRKQQDLSGLRFGRLQVIKLGDFYVDGCGTRRRKWICKCDCGNTCEVLSSPLKSGRTKSCGCLIHESSNSTHNLSGTRLYRIWQAMKNRCFNSKCPYYKHYGGRGIAVCEEWKNNFEMFYEWAMANGYKEDLTIDRINNDGGYEPNNCRWATRKQQQLNRRNIKFLSFNGKTLTQKEWGLELGGGVSLVENRLLSGWSLEEALSTPVRKGSYKRK